MVTIEPGGKGKCSLSGKECNGVWATFKDGSFKNVFLSWNALKQLVELRTTFCNLMSWRRIVMRLQQVTRSVGNNLSTEQAVEENTAGTSGPMSYLLVIYLAGLPTHGAWWAKSIRTPIFGLVICTQSDAAPTEET